MGKKYQKTTYNKDMINHLIDILKQEGECIRNDSTSTVQERLAQADIILNTLRFLKDYDENVKILNQEWARRKRVNKHKQDKPAKTSEKGKYNRTRTKQKTNQIIEEEHEL